MYEKNIVSLYEILEKEPKTPAEVENREKSLEKYEELVNNWIKRHLKEIGKIEKIFLNYNSSRSMFNGIFGYPSSGDIPYCGKESKESLEGLFLNFKGSSKKLSIILRDELLNIESSPSGIFEGINKLFKVVNFKKEDMLKAVDIISKLLKQSKNNVDKDYENLVKYRNNYLGTTGSNGGKDSELYLGLLCASFPAFVESMVYGEKRGGKISSSNKMITKLKANAKHTVNRAIFKKSVDDFCRDFDINLKDTMSNKIQKIYEKSNECRKKIISKYKDDIEGKVSSEKQNEKPESTKPLPTPPQKPLPIPPKNNAQKSDGTSSSNDKSKNHKKPLPSTPPQKPLPQTPQKGDVRQKSEPPQKPLPTPPKNSEQTSDGISSSNDTHRNRLSKLFGRKRRKGNNAPNGKSKNPSTSNDESKNQKKRFSKLFGRKRKKDNNVPNEESTISKISNDTSTSSPNNAHQKELKRAVERRSQYIKPDEISTES